MDQGFFYKKPRTKNVLPGFEFCAFFSTFSSFSRHPIIHVLPILFREKKNFGRDTQKSILLARNIQSTTGSIGIIVYSSHPIPFVQKQACCVESQNCNTQNTTRIEG